MSLYSGIQGKVSTAPNSNGTKKDIAHISEWNLTRSTNTVDGSYFLEEYTETVATSKTWSATFSGTPDYDSASGQADLETAFDSGAALQYTFQLADGVFFQGLGIIESLEHGQTRDGLATLSVSVKGTLGVELTTD
jgi:predicted secreted protein